MLGGPHPGHARPPQDMRSTPSTYTLMVALAFVTLGGGLRCQASPAGPDGQAGSRTDQICPLIESAARANTLPIDFFVRLIWRESHFRPDVKGPVTANGQRAEGIAQFMPATAAEHNLAEPFNPSAALPKSGEFLAELRDQFGNLGLAAAAYNAGPQRVRDYLSGSKSLPTQTQNYVLAITGHSVDEWKAAPALANEASSLQAIVADNKAVTSGEPVSTCRDLLAHIDQTPGRLPLQRQATVPFERQIRRVSFEPQTIKVIGEVLKRHVPSWCSGLRNPNVAVCGDVHMREPKTKTAGLLAHTELHRFHIHLRRLSLQ